MININQNNTFYLGFKLLEEEDLIKLSRRQSIINLIHLSACRYLTMSSSTLLVQILFNQDFKMHGYVVKSLNKHLLNLFYLDT